MEVDEKLLHKFLVLVLEDDLDGFFVVLADLAVLTLLQNDIVEAVGFLSSMTAEIMQDQALNRLAILYVLLEIIVDSLNRFVNDQRSIELLKAVHNALFQKFQALLILGSDYLA